MSTTWFTGALLALSLAACGGSSSETPWPAEPDTPPPGPAGETLAPPAGVDELPSAPTARPTEVGPAKEKATPPPAPRAR